MSSRGWPATAKPLYVADVFIDQRYLRTPDLPASQSELAIPLKVEERVIGVLNLEADHRDAFTKDEIAVLEGLARMIGVALQQRADVQVAARFQPRSGAGDPARQSSQPPEIAFSLNASQRFRAPLHTIISSTETMPTAGLPDAVTRTPAPYSRKRARPASVGRRYDRSVGDRSRALQLNLQWIKLTPLLEEVMNAARALHMAGYADHKLTLKLDLMHLMEPLPPVWADLERLRYILMNLVSNAIKFTESGEVVLSADFDKDNVYIHVRDTGPGIGDDNRRYLFEPFQHQRGKLETSDEGDRAGSARVAPAGDAARRRSDGEK